mmetsp:Transcript_20970/g.45903  ORF Transcript_20970/g.45903 Transcript_20970/m.45903 type:complete len:200 (-) Transcript_20970:277-876(-)
MILAVNALVAPHMPECEVDPADQPARVEQPLDRLLNVQEEVQRLARVDHQHKCDLTQVQYRLGRQQGSHVQQQRTAGQQQPAAGVRLVLALIAADLLKAQLPPQELIAQGDGAALDRDVRQCEVDHVVRTQVLAEEVGCWPTTICALVHLLAGQTCINRQALDHDDFGAVALVILIQVVRSLPTRVVQGQGGPNQQDAN